jgi:ABC-type bacteriocin/lantibiotic exporter with double-glycine peptidase domain
MNNFKEILKSNTNLHLVDDKSLKLMLFGNKLISIIIDIIGILIFFLLLITIPLPFISFLYGLILCIVLFFSIAINILKELINDEIKSR